MSSILEMNRDIENAADAVAMLDAAIWANIARSGVPTNSAIAPAALPPAAGGVDVAGSLTSVIPGIRKLKKISVSTALPLAAGQVSMDLPKSSYMQKMVIRLSGTLRVVQGGTQQTITATDPRSYVSSIEFQLSGSTSPRKLSGIQNDLIDGLDVPAVAPNTTVYSAGPAGAASSTTDTPFSMEFSPVFCVSDTNLYGIPYLGGQATVPKLILTLADPNGSLAVQGAAGPTITMQNGLVEVETWRVDLPGPVAPQTITQYVDGNAQSVQVPGQGLYIESSYLLLTKVLDSADLTSAGTTKKFKLPIGPDYLRMIVLSIKGGVLDDETAPLIDHADLLVQQATAIESKKIWQFNNEYVRTYNKARPKGVYVFSGIDLTGTDADLYVSRELGNFDIDCIGSAVTPPANSRFTVMTQQLLPMSAPGEYL